MRCPQVAGSFLRVACTASFVANNIFLILSRGRSLTLLSLLLQHSRKCKKGHNRKGKSCEYLSAPTIGTHSRTSVEILASFRNSQQSVSHAALALAFLRN